MRHCNTRCFIQFVLLCSSAVCDQRAVPRESVVQQWGVTGALEKAAACRRAAFLIRIKRQQWRANQAADQHCGVIASVDADREMAGGARARWRRSSPVPRHPNPAAVSLAPMTRDPIRACVRAGDVAAGYPHPTVSAPAPVPRLPNHGGARWGRDHLLLRRGRSARRAISRVGIRRWRRASRITRRLTGIGIGGRRILLCHR